MPKPKNWTDEMLARRDKCVSDLKAKGTDESKAYAICTASIREAGPKKQGG